MFSSHELDTFAAVNERDVDFALVQAIRASGAVRQLLATAAGSSDAELLSVWHSKATVDGREADIVVRLGNSDLFFEIQVENKLDASFQPNQAASYAARVRTLAQSAEVSGASALLVAPQAYLAEYGVAVEGFHGMVSYESLRDLLVKEGRWGRGIALVLEHAVRQHRRGGRPSPDDAARTEFFAAFAAKGHARGLPHIPKTGRKSQATCLWYPRADTLAQLSRWTPENPSQGVWLAAKFDDGYADIELTGAAPVIDLGSLTPILRADGVAVVQTGKSVYLRSSAPHLSPDRPADEQAEEISMFIDHLLELRDWWTARGRHLVEASLRGDSDERRGAPGPATR